MHVLLVRSYETSCSGGVATLEARDDVSGDMSVGPSQS